MCQTMISDVDDMDEITSTCHKKTGKLIEPRKIRKPLMEKKRRARINQSLDELKRIVVEAEKLAGQDLSRVNKLEKADILEMTVRYLKRNRTTATAAPDVYLAGYRQCMEQVQDLLAEQWTDERRRQSGRRMVEHLEVCVRRLNVPPRNHRLVSSSSSDDDLARSTRHDSPGPVAATATATAAVTNAASSDDDSVEDEPLAARPPSPADRTTTPQFRPRDTTTKSTWRPW